jgi:hypothetical protein
MTRDDIIRMAREAGFNMVHYSNREPLLCEAWGDEIHLESFAALVAAHEREACAVLAENGLLGITIAQAIRARGEKP